MPAPLNRRTLLRTALFAGAAGAVGPSLLSACGSGGGGAATTAERAAAPAHRAVAMPVTADLPGTANGVPDTFFNYPADPPVTVPNVPGDGKPLSVMTQTYFPIPPGVEDNAYRQELNRRLGVDLEMSITPGADYGTSRFPTVVAGNGLPDYFLVATVPQMPQFMAATCVDLSEHLSGDAILKYPNLANIPSETWEVGRHGGRLYGIPAPRGINLADFMYRRDDLLAPRGLDREVANFEEFVDVCREVNDPARGVWANATVPLTFIRQSLLVPNTWSESGGRFRSAYEYIDEQEQALESGRRLFAEGLVNPDAFASPNAKQWFLAGTAIFMIDSSGPWRELWQRNIAGESFDLGMLPVPAFAGGGSGVAWRMTPTYWYGAVNKNAADRVETILQIANYLAAPFGSAEYLFLNNGVEGTHHTIDGTNPVLTDRGKTEKEIGLNFIGGPAMVNYLPGRERSVRKLRDAQVRTIDTAVRNPALFLYSESDSRKGVALVKTMDALRDDILQGRRPVSDWRVGVDAWRAGGGEAMRGEYEQAFAESQPE